MAKDLFDPKRELLPPAKTKQEQVSYTHPMLEGVRGIKLQ
jgi:hypothetical protein